MPSDNTSDHLKPKPEPTGTSQPQLGGKGIESLSNPLQAAIQKLSDQSFIFVIAVAIVVTIVLAVASPSIELQLGVVIIGVLASVALLGARRPGNAQPSASAKTNLTIYVFDESERVKAVNDALVVIGGMHVKGSFRTAHGLITIEVPTLYLGENIAVQVSAEGYAKASLDRVKLVPDQELEIGLSPIAGIARAAAGSSGSQYEPSSTAESARKRIEVSVPNQPIIQQPSGKDRFGWVLVNCAAFALAALFFHLASAGATSDLFLQLIFFLLMLIVIPGAQLFILRRRIAGPIRWLVAFPIGLVIGLILTYIHAILIYAILTPDSDLIIALWFALGGPALLGISVAAFQLLFFLRHATGRSAWLGFNALASYFACAVTWGLFMSIMAFTNQDGIPLAPLAFSAAMGGTFYGVISGVQLGRWWQVRDR